MSIKLYSCGAAEEVTGSKHFLEINGKKILIDCGSFQGHRKDSEEKNRNFPFDPREIEASICTHAHFDHCGSYPALVKKGFNGNIYAVPATRDLMSIVMMDSAMIQAKDYEYLKKKALKRDERFDIEPIYNEKDVIESLGQIVTISNYRPFNVTDSLKATFYNAGHILGSSQVYLEAHDGNRYVRIGFTGDLGRKNLPILKDPDILPEIDYLVCESTYGNKLHDDLELSLNELSRIINETFEKRGKIIIPAFAIERTQELVYYLQILFNEKRIPKIPVYVDSPMATNVTSIFKIHPECFDEDLNKLVVDRHKNPFDFDGLYYITGSEDSKKLNEIHEPMIIIASSGMCEAGRILHHLAHNVENPNNVILIVGYMAENTLGRRIEDREKSIKIFDNMYELKADVKTLNFFSAHADYNEIKSYILGLKHEKIKKVFLVHGEKEAQANLSRIIEEIGIEKVQAMRFGETYELYTHH